MLGQATSVAALNSDAFEDASSLGAESIRIMGTPVAADFLRVPKCERSDKIRRVIFVGRLALEKGLDQVLSAAAALPDIDFSIAGDGPGRRHIEKAVQRLGNVQYLGWLSRTGVLKELDRSDLLLLPSSIEAFGTVALEALARGRHVLVRPECGIAKWPSLTRGLFTIQPNESVVDALTRLIKTPPASRNQISQRGWNAVEDFNCHTIRRWLEFLADAAELRVPDRALNLSHSDTR